MNEKEQDDKGPKGYDAEKDTEGNRGGGDTTTRKVRTDESGLRTRWQALRRKELQG